MEHKKLLSDEDIKDCVYPYEDRKISFSKMAKLLNEKANEALILPVVTNCTTCAFTDSKYTEETCNKCSRDFDKYEPK